MPLQAPFVVRVEQLDRKPIFGLIVRHAFTPLSVAPEAHHAVFDQQATGAALADVGGLRSRGTVFESFAQLRQIVRVPSVAFRDVRDSTFGDPGQELAGQRGVFRGDANWRQHAVSLFEGDSCGGPPLEPGVNHRQSAHAHVVAQRGVVLDQRFGFRPQLGRPVEEGVRVVRRGRRTPDSQHVLVGLDQCLQFVEVLPYRFGGGAVITLEEVPIQRLDVLIRIPEQLGENPRPQLSELGMRRLIRALLE